MNEIARVYRLRNSVGISIQGWADSVAGITLTTAQADMLARYLMAAAEDIREYDEDETDLHVMTLSED